MNNLAVAGMLIAYHGAGAAFLPDVPKYATQNAVDFSENFKTDRLFFVTNISELKKVLYELYRYKANATFSYLDYYKTHGRDFNEIAEFLKREIILIDHNYNFQVNNTRSFFFSTLKRLAEKYKLKRLSDYKDTFLLERLIKNIPIVV